MVIQGNSGVLCRLDGGAHNANGAEQQREGGVLSSIHKVLCTGTAAAGPEIERFILQ